MELQNFALLSIEYDSKKLKKLEPRTFFNAVGKNTGNLLFTKAVIKQLKGNINKIDGFFDFSPEEISKNNDFIIIPAANWISESLDWGKLALVLEKTTIPIIILGLGAQSNINGNIPELKKGTLRFLSILSDRSESISVRGSFTAKVLNHYGIKNVINTGCPSFFYNMEDKIELQSKIENKIQPNDFNLAFSSTRYALQDIFLKSSNNNFRINRNLFRASFSTNSKLIFQSEFPELSFINKNIITTENSQDKIKSSLSEIGEENLQKLLAVYEAKNLDSLIDYLLKNGIYFSNLENWISYFRNIDLLISTRLHGTIASILAGTPAILIPHDSRTKEVVEDFRLPNIEPHIKELGEKLFFSRENLFSLYKNLDFLPFQKSYSEKYQILHQFYEKNSIKNHLY